MTVLAAVKTATGCVIGADSRVTTDDHINTDDFAKVRRYGSTVVAVYGADGRALEDLREARARSYAAILAYVQGRKPSTEWGLLVYDASSHRLVTLCGDGTELDYTRVATAGAGAALALGALTALREWAPRAAVRRAISIACEHNTSCGGRVRVVEARRRR